MSQSYLPLILISAFTHRPSAEAIPCNELDGIVNLDYSKHKFGKPEVGTFQSGRETFHY